MNASSSAWKISFAAVLREIALDTLALYIIFSLIRFVAPIIFADTFRLEFLLWVALIALGLGMLMPSGHEETPRALQTYAAPLATLSMILLLLAAPMSNTLSLVAVLLFGGIFWISLRAIFSLPKPPHD